MKKISNAKMKIYSTDVLWDALHGQSVNNFMNLYAFRLRPVEFEGSLPLDACARVAWAVKHGADVAGEREGRFPALAAVELRNAELFAVLVAASAPLEKEGGFKGACVRAAARMNQPDVLQAVLAARADPDARPNTSCSTALIAACQGMNDDQALTCAELLLKAGAHIEARMEPLGITPLIAAARCGNEAVCDRLLECGANIDALLINGHSAASEARDAGFGELASKLAELVVLKEAWIISAGIHAAPARRRQGL